MLGSRTEHFNILDWEVRIGKHLFDRNMTTNFDFLAFRDFAKGMGNFGKSYIIKKY